MTGHLKELVIRKIRELGEERAAEFFEVGPKQLRQWVSGSKKISLAAVEKVFSLEEFSKLSERQEANWDGVKVALLLPFYRSVDPRTSFAITSMFDRKKMALFQKTGDAFIIHTRNKLASQFRKSGIEWSVWFDDDVVPPFGNPVLFQKYTGFKISPKHAGQHTVNRLLSHGKTLVGGFYTGRNAKRRPMFGNLGTAGELAFYDAAPHDVVKEVPWVATGCLAVHQSVYHDIEELYPQLKPQFPDDDYHYFSNSETDLTGSVNEALAVLQDVTVDQAARLAKAEELLAQGKHLALVNSTLRQGEDVTFCKRALAAGHQPYVDLGLICGHVGQHVFGPRSLEA